VMVHGSDVRVVEEEVGKVCDLGATVICKGWRGGGEFCQGAKVTRLGSYARF
jgi:hypothetical protein